MEGRIVIIDGNSLINRAYYAMQRPMITKEGIYTQGIYGFLNMLKKIEDDYEPSHISVAFDMKAPTFRHLEYDDYKAGRKSMPPELAMQMPILKDILKAMNIHTMELEGFEADDLIGTVSKKAEEAGIEPIIVTGDKDALQLASNITKIVITKKGVTDFDIYDDKKMVERYGLTPLQFIDLKGLMGDASDNIPGVPGVGEKTGIALLEQFGSIENMLENTSEISKKALKQKVEDNAQLAIMSKRLATINRDVPIEIDFKELKFTEANYSQLIEIYKKLEFNSFLKKLKNIEPKENSEPVKEVSAKVLEKIIISVERDLALLEELSPIEKVFLKVFTDGNHVGEPEITGICLATDNKIFYVDALALSIKIIVEKINELNLNFIGNNIKADLYSLMYYGLDKFKVIFDTEIAEYVLDSSKKDYSLKALVMDKFNGIIPSESDFFKEKGQINMFGNVVEDYLAYVELLTHYTWKVMEVQGTQIDEMGLEKVLYDFEIPLVEVMASMEVEGIGADKVFLEDFGKEIQVEIQELELKIYDLAGEEFNINSPMQLGNILFEKLGLPASKKTKKGYSTSADVLEKIKDKHSIIEEVLTYRNITKLNSTYVEGLKPLISNKGKIHAHFQQTVTTTGRISCTEPNLQNIPIRSELGRKIRQAFISGDGYTFIGADYSQIELRVLAHLSQDEALIESFNKSEDIHKTTASRMFDIPMEKVTALDRSRAKAVNFGVIYGMSGFGLSENLSIGIKEAEKYIKEYFIKHEKVKEYMDNQIKLCKALGYSETISGRKRYIHEINASNYMVRQLGERLAMNTPIQGSAADIIKLAMIKVYNALKNSFPDSKLVLQVHDELIICAKNEDVPMVKKLLKENMESAIDLSVKLLTEANEGKSWYELK